MSSIHPTDRRSSSSPVSQPTEMGRASPILQQFKSALAARAERGHLTKEQYEAFTANYQTLLKLKALDHVLVKEGRLTQVATPTTEQQQKAAAQLIQQVYLDCWKLLLVCDHGYAIKEERLHQLNRLQEHMHHHFTSLLPQEPSNTPVHILSGAYQRSQEATLSPESKARLKELREKRIEQVRARVFTQPLSAERRGMNPAKFVGIEARKPLAIEKPRKDIGVGPFIEEALHPKTYSKQHSKKYNELGGIDETLTAQLNLILGGRLPVPLALVSEETTVHAFAGHKGTYYTLTTADPGFVQQMDSRSCQRFALMEMIVGNNDAHGSNILIDSQNRPIGIDFGRILFPDPLHQDGKMRAAYLKFPGLDEPLNPEDRKFYEELDVDATIKELGDLLKQQFPEQCRDAELGAAIRLQLQQLHARLCMVKEGVKAGLTPRQLLGLQFPPLGKPLTRYSYERLKGLSMEETRKQLTGHFNAHGFYKAWARAMKTGT